jgi:type 1 glutamine amidotransferase
MHVDPGVKVLATTKFPAPGADGPHVRNGTFDMPVLWTRYHGNGRVFYNSLGHSAAVVASEPCLTIMRRGFKWAAEGKKAAGARAA